MSGASQLALPTWTVGVRAAVAALTGGLFLEALDQNLFATTLPTVAGDVGAGTHLSWISTATVGLSLRRRPS